VTGGRVSEGIDFPSRDLELAIIVGLPYPRPSFKKEALIRYFDRRFSNGWEAVVKTPMVRKMRQARGRLIRSETDRGAAIILDNRVTQIYGFGAIPTKDAVSDINDFFDELLTPSDLALRRQAL
jgi:DNA excision repair protein ERCC-2